MVSFFVGDKYLTIDFVVKIICDPYYIVGLKLIAGMMAVRSSEEREMSEYAVRGGL